MSDSAWPVSVEAFSPRLPLRLLIRRFRFVDPPVLVLNARRVRATAAPDVEVLDGRPGDREAAGAAEAVDREHLLRKVAVELVQQAAPLLGVDLLLALDDRSVDQRIACESAAADGS